VTALAMLTVALAKHGPGRAGARADFAIAAAARLVEKT